VGGGCGEAVAGGGERRWVWAGRVGGLEHGGDLGGRGGGGGGWEERGGDGVVVGGATGWVGVRRNHLCFPEGPEGNRATAITHRSRPQ